jgi:hypothetical protein
MKKTTNPRQNPEADRIPRARALLIAAAEGVKHLKREANYALRRFFSLTEMMARLRRLTVSPEPEAAGTAALYAATLCRETMALLHYIDSRSRRTEGACVAPRVRPKPGAAPKVGGATEGSAAVGR